MSGEPDRNSGMRVTVMGLGLFGGGAAAAAYFAGRGARVVVTDLKDRRTLSPSISPLKKFKGIEFVLGRHREDDFASTDLVIANPAVPPSNTYLELARRKGIGIDYEMCIFLRKCRAPVVAVTGSNGKSTTSALIDRMLSASGAVSFLGGNIGRPLLGKLEEINASAAKRATYAVVEMSSFQLEVLDERVRPPLVAVVTNITPNHLDRHGTMDAYISAKMNLLRLQDRRCTAVLNAEDAILKRRGARTGRAKKVYFGLKKRRMPGLYRVGGVALNTAYPRRPGVVADLAKKALKGEFNDENILAAAAAVLALPEANIEGVAETVRTFSGIPHRLEFVCEKGGVSYYDDSIATSPESTVRAVDALKADFGGLVVILGGYDKGLDYGAMASALAAEPKVRKAVLYGKARNVIRESLDRAGFRRYEMNEAFDDAVGSAKKAARAGYAVILSPACASYDSFDNFTARGTRFKKLVRSGAKR